MGAVGLVILLISLAPPAFAAASMQDQSDVSLITVSGLHDEVEIIDNELISAMESAVQDDLRYSKLSLFRQVSSGIEDRLSCLSGKLRIQRLVTDVPNQRQSIEIILRDVDSISKSTDRWARTAERLPHGGLRQSDVKIVLRLRDYVRRLATRLSAVRY